MINCSERVGMAERDGSEPIMNHNDSYFISCIMQTWAFITLARELFKRSGFVTVEIGPSSVDHKSQWCNKSRQKFARLKKEKFCDKSRPDWSLISSFPHRGDRSSDRPHLARIAWQIHARAGFIANLMTSANCFIRNFQNSSWTIEKCLFFAFSARSLQIILIFYDQP